jgi:DNA-binding MarR family transcriptional regulator
MGAHGDRELGLRRLKELKDELGWVTEILSGHTDDPSRTVSPRFIRSILRARRLRASYLDMKLFADPAWDMLLDLLAAKLEGTRVSVSSLSVAAAVPATTALRWISRLTSKGYILRVEDPADGRRFFLELSEETSRQLIAYLNAAISAGAMLA